MCVICIHYYSKMDNRINFKFDISLTFKIWRSEVALYGVKYSAS